MIAERVFASGEKTVRLQIFSPTPHSADARCAFKLVGPQGEIDGHAFGVDAVQALQLALQKAHIMLLSDSAYASVRWLDQQDLGLPLPIGLTVDDVLQAKSVRDDEATV